MARILEAMKQARPAHARADEGPVPRPYYPDAPASNESEAEAEIPYIEVGGPDRTFEASPSVLGSIAEAAARPRDTQENQETRLSTRPPGFAEAGLVHVSFRPLPAPVIPQRPAYERFAPEIVTFHQPEHVVSEQYRSLLAGLEAQLPGGQPHVLLFAGACPQAGTTTVLLNLAITRARRNQCRVLLVDANFERPAVAERLGLPAAPGLSEVLAGTVSPRRALQETGEAGLHALTAGDAGAIAHDLVSGEAMRSVLRYLRGRFNLVLVDAPAWDGRPEVIALGSACDAVYLVLPQAHVDAPETHQLLTTIPQQGGRLRGWILTHP